MTRFTNRLHNQTVLIVGGSGGIGMSIAAACLEFGANVIITASRQSKLDTQLEVLRKPHADLKASTLAGFPCDLASADVENNVTQLLSSVQAHLSSHNLILNHLIYTAGDAISPMSLDAINLDNFNKAVQVRVASCLLTIKHISPLLPKTNKSTITLTSGSASVKSMPGGWSVLAFVAAGLNGMTRTLAVDLQPVRVNIVVPGVVDTGLWDGMSESERKDFYDHMERQLPTGAVPSPDDIAEAYLYLMRDTNVTGANIHTNGGHFL